jgi:hypothetical protein
MEMNCIKSTQRRLAAQVSLVIGRKVNIADVPNFPQLGATVKYSASVIMIMLLLIAQQNAKEISGTSSSSIH